MEIKLENKVAIVTGASKGIGKAIAITLAQSGCEVVLAARGSSELNNTCAEIKNAGYRALAVSADVTQIEDVNKIVAKTAAAFGKIDILINNAGGVSDFLPFEAISDQAWLDMFELNLFSAVKMSRAVIPYMQQQKYGRIINIGSESGVQPDAVIPHYNAVKAGIINFSKTLSKAYGKDGILVNTVSPAFILTSQIQKIIEEKAKQYGVSTEELKQKFLREQRPSIQLNRAGLPQEVAAAVVFLASDQASFITGANLRVDGGSVATV